mmetsp:Transcript_11946/g.34239  ORF Transcript_11946/g.34239 Transcript_11946/m.34239 type:complete len:536 (-) Transcript_11946:46-1653(-)
MISLWNLKRAKKGGNKAIRGGSVEKSSANALVQRGRKCNTAANVGGTETRSWKKNAYKSIFHSFSTDSSSSSSTDYVVSSSDSSIISEISNASSTISDNSIDVGKLSELPVHDANLLFRPGLYSPIDLLEKVICPTTPKSDSIEALIMLQIIEYYEYIIEIYRDAIKTRYIPELLQYIRINVQDFQCVYEAIDVLRWLLSLLDSGDETVEKDNGSTNPLIFIEARAISILVLALTFHQNNERVVVRRNQQTCVFGTIWNFLVDLVSSPSVVTYFQEHEDPEGNHYDREKKYQRMKLLIAVDTCLDQTGTAMSFSWVTKVFLTLNTLLRTKTDEKTIPNNNVRQYVWKKQIAEKCQNLLDKKTDEHISDHDHYYYHWFKYEAASVSAISFFWFCLGDKKDDLSKSLNRPILTRFVKVVMEEFPRSGYIQGVGCQIMQELDKLQKSQPFTWLSPPERFSLGTTRTILSVDHPPCTNNSMQTSDTFESEDPALDHMRQRRRKNKKYSKKEKTNSITFSALFDKLCVCTEDEALQNHIF